MELATFRKEIAANTVSNMRPLVGHEQAQTQRSALKSVGLLVKVERETGSNDVDMESCAHSPDDIAELEPESKSQQEHDDTEPPWLRNRRPKEENVHAEQEFGRGDNSESERQTSAAKNSDNGQNRFGSQKASDAGVSFVSVSDTLVLRCSTGCSPKALWRYVRDHAICQIM